MSLSCTSDKMLTSRPPWVGPDYHPKDLDKNTYAFLHDFNPNEPNMPKSALLFHNRWGILKKKHALTTDPMRELGLSTQRRRDGHRALTVSKHCNQCVTLKGLIFTDYVKTFMLSFVKKKKKIKKKNYNILAECVKNPILF